MIRNSGYIFISPEGDFLARIVLEQEECCSFFLTKSLDNATLFSEPELILTSNDDWPLEHRPGEFVPIPAYLEKRMLLGGMP